MFIAAAVAMICLILPAGAIWAGIESLDRTTLPTEW